MKSKVQAPAIALIVLGALGVLLMLFSLVAPQDPEAMREAFLEADMDSATVDKMVDGMTRFSVLSNVIGLAISALVIVAGARMLQMKNWALAVTASIVAMVPCWCCCILGIPIGVWSLIVLLDKDVKAAFGVAATPPAPPPL
jgi:putative Mn2+ efflux pump MntP